MIFYNLISNWNQNSKKTLMTLPFYEKNYMLRSINQYNCREVNFSKNKNKRRCITKLIMSQILQIQATTKTTDKESC